MAEAGRNRRRCALSEYPPVPRRRHAVRAWAGCGRSRGGSYNGYNVSFTPRRMSSRTSSMRTGHSGGPPSRCSRPGRILRSCSHCGGSAPDVHDDERVYGWKAFWGMADQLRGTDHADRSASGWPIMHDRVDADPVGRTSQARRLSATLDDQPAHGAIAGVQQLRKMEGLTA
jgi:hypothetical protein